MYSNKKKKFLKMKIKPNTVIILLLIIIVIVLISSMGEDTINNFLVNALKLNSQSNNTNNVDIYNDNFASDNDDASIDSDNFIQNERFVTAKVDRIVDGDTIAVIMAGKEYKVRFIGVNCPEDTTKKEEYGHDATEYTKEKLTGKTVYLEKDISETDKYGRLLRYVWLEKPNKINDEEIRNKMFNAGLLLDGYANIATYPPDVNYNSYFKKYEKEARYSHKGLWK